MGKGGLILGAGFWDKLLAFSVAYSCACGGYPDPLLDAAVWASIVPLIG